MHIVAAAPVVIAAAVDHAVEAIPAVAANSDCIAFLSNGPEFWGRFLLVRVPFYCETLLEGLRRRLEKVRSELFKESDGEQHQNQQHGKQREAQLRNARQDFAGKIAP